MTTYSVTLLPAGQARPFKTLSIDAKAGTTITLRLGQVVWPRRTLETWVTHLGPGDLAAAIPPRHFKPAHRNL